MGGCRFLFGQMKKAWEGPGHKRTRGGQTIPMAKGAAKAKGAPKPKEVAKEKGAAKRKRGRSNGDTVALEDDDEEILQVKKMKTESEAEEIGGEIKEESTTELSDGGVEI